MYGFLRREGLPFMNEFPDDIFLLCLFLYIRVLYTQSSYEKYVQLNE